MGGKAGLVPIALAVGFGILNGYWVFKPAFDEREAQKILETSPKQTEPTYSRQIFNWWAGNSPTDKTGQQK
ncbi:hypothetical protein MGYG_02257 [Nannizzia gypsea CBS 118893]|uniref:Uncharacterized protein n=1 Tax=Arthroderma gypseum (strain ATCC MYA-4604 / CBS 118893) TaxID=535722 RepID=E4UQL5_ARTGP|nr:hypothetical protein MGYG_02257 [Nannizzia gypsea CBS 118893]EFQ99244.1 hypothetical protein MGYG_02257 [Nannizzia gypsea CBS 118893]